MDHELLKELLADYKEGRLSEEEVISRLRGLPFTDLGHTKVDHHRALRQGAAEVIFAPGKTGSQIVSIMKEMEKAGSKILVTRVSADQARAVKKAFPKVSHNRTGRTMRLPAGSSKKKKKNKDPGVLVLSGGTSDAHVVEEAMETLDWLGLPARSIPDVGVAGIHRLLAFREDLEKAKVIIVAAGMEGALASVVAGLVNKPVIGVPVAVGYGAGMGGYAALLGMLNSCAAGVSVVNIDNGFGAAFAAARVLRQMSEQESGR
ncbi:MAG: nickel pincer cofactor biosynthesis protein LarB [bacterium]